MHKIEARNEMPSKLTGEPYTVCLTCVCGNVTYGYSYKTADAAKTQAFEYWWRHKEGREVREAA